MINRRKSQRREHSRAKVNWPAVVVSKHATIQGRVDNLSRGGALLYLEGPVEENESIRIAIEIPEYNDVISTVGRVVRIYNLDINEEKYSYAVGVQFTDLSSEDLRFFTGNLAPEWGKNYQEPERSLPLNDILKRSAGYVLLGVLALVLTVFVFRSFTGKKIDAPQLIVLETRLKNIESKLEIFSEMTAANSKVEDHLLAIQTELSSLHNEFATMAVVEQLQEQISSNQQQLADMEAVTLENSQGIAELESLDIPNPKPSDPPEIAVPKPLDLPEIAVEREEPTPSAPVYHLVKKGENLYRISLKYGVDVGSLRKLNKLSVNDSIHPNQKLLIK